MTIMTFGVYQPPNVEPITTDIDWQRSVKGSPSMKTWLERLSDDGNI